MDYVLIRLPFPVHSIQADKGIEHRYIKPRNLRLNGNAERPHWIDEVVIDNSGLFNEKLKEWENFYNFQRPHGSFGGGTPFEGLQEKLKEFRLTEDAL